MKSSTIFLLQFIFLTLTQLTISISSLSTSQPCKQKQPTFHYGLDNNMLHRFSLNSNTIITLILCFVASSASSAGGVGGGSLFLLILTLIADLPLQLATALSIFMVTAVTFAKVLHTFCFVDRSLVNYEIALLSEPCMLLGVSVGVLCNIMFPEWLVTALFTVFLATTTAKTLRSGCRIWSRETEAAERARIEIQAPLLREREGKRIGEGRNMFPWKDLGVLVIIWMCFFVLHFLIGDQNGKASAIKHNLESLPMYTFPAAATLTGVLSGLFGIGGGLLLNPVFLQIGMPPQRRAPAATSSFMVLFSASMSMVHYILLGMTRISEAAMYTILCFVASVVGLVTMQRVIAKSGRVSLVVFLVCGLMALSTVVVTLFGALHVWNQVANGEYMGIQAAMLNLCFVVLLLATGT